MCLASHGKIDVMLMRTLTKTFLAQKQNIPGLKMRGFEIGDFEIKSYTQMRIDKTSLRMFRIGLVILLDYF